MCSVISRVNIKKLMQRNVTNSQLISELQIWKYPNAQKENKKKERETINKGNKQKTNKINLNQIILILYINGMNIQIKQIIRIDKNAGSNYMLAIRLHFQYKET